MQLKKKHLLKILHSNEIITNVQFIKLDKDFFGRKNVDPMLVYKELGGIQSQFPFHFKEFIKVGNSTLLELDSDLHFNRYRSLTLRSDLYNQIPYFPLENYRRYCRVFEKECLKSGLKNGIWSNDQSNDFFGISSDPGDFFGNGSGGWKLRAFMDYLEDLAACALNLKIVRLAVFDNFMAEGKLVRIDTVLERENHPLSPHLMKFINRKLTE